MFKKNLCPPLPYATCKRDLAGGGYLLIVVLQVPFLNTIDFEFRLRFR